MSEATESHRRHGEGEVAHCGVVTLSDSRSLADDASGDLIEGRLRAAGHAIDARVLLRDEKEALEELLREWIGRLDLIVSTGGTGLGRRDGTIEVVEGLLERSLPGFGELFRMLSFEEIGSAAMLSRAVAGQVGSTLVFALPGSTAAVRLAMDRLICPELGHLLGVVRR